MASSKEGNRRGCITNADIWQHSKAASAFIIFCITDLLAKQDCMDKLCNALLAIYGNVRNRIHMVVFTVIAKCAQQLTGDQ